MCRASTPQEAALVSYDFYLALGPRVSFWPMWVLIFWGVGLVLHAWHAFSKQETTEAEVQAEIRRMKGPGPGAGD